MNLQPAFRSTRRALPLVLIAPLLPPRRLPQRPVFVIGCPRSGTTVTFHLVRRLPGFTSIRAEGGVLWETFHHPSRRRWHSSGLRSQDIRGIERRYLAWAIPLLAGKGRFVDKTPRNCLRLPYLDALFPDATYVFVQRDGRAIVDSLIRQWRKRKRPNHILPEPFSVPGIRDRWWHFLLPPGWRELNGRSLEEICAYQYVAAVEAMLAFRERLDTKRSFILRYEDIVHDPIGEVKRVHEWFGLPFGEHDRDAVGRIVKTPGGKISATQNPKEIERVLPMISSAMERTGYRT